jgi:hypothetical protein
MYSVFSNYLEPLGVEFDEEAKLSEVYRQLRIAYNQGVKGVLESTRIVTSGNEDEDYRIINAIWSNDALHKIVRWINEKITLIMGIADYRTIDVRIRIATNMMDNLTDDVSPRLRTIIFGNLISNVRRELGILGTEDLPF